MRLLHPPHPLPPAPPLARLRRAFTLIEIMIVVVIISIASIISLDAISSFEANQRPDRAARESLAFFRFARTLAMTTGKKTKVAVDTSANTLSVYWQSNGTAYDPAPYATSMTATGAMTLDMTTNRELIGTTLSLNPAATTYFEYGPLGSSAQTGTVTFSYASKSKSLVISNVGDPQLQ